MSEKSANKPKSKRARNWCAVVYPDSAPEDWRTILDREALCYSVSPLHDSDCDDDGVLKKAHWHIIIAYSGPKSFEQVQEDLAPLNCPIPQVCRDVRSSLRYFLHLDHPHKAQYDRAQIEAYGGFDVDAYLEMSTSERRSTLKDLLAYCRENEIHEYADLIDNLLSNDLNDYFVLATEKNTLAITAYLKSARHSRYRGITE